MRRLALLLSCLSSAPTLAQVSPDWSFFPGYFSPGGSGIVTAELDGMGNPETIVTGSSVNSFSFSQSLHLATLEHQGTRYATTHLLNIDSAWSFSGPLQALRLGPGSVDRVVVSLRNNNSQETVIATFGGKPLREISRVAAPVNFSLRQIDDIDGDGQLEALGCTCASFGDGPAVLLDYATGNVEWTDGSASQFVGAGQLDSDPALEIVLGSQSTSPVTPGRIVDGATRAQQWSYPDGFRGNPVFGNFRGSADAREFAIVERWGVTRIFVSQPIFSPVAEINSGEVGAYAVQDVNGDGFAELIIGEGQWGSIVAYSTTTGQTVFDWPNNEHGVSAIALGNLDGQSGLELVYGAGLSHSGRDVLRVIDTASGTLRHESSDEGGPHSTLVRVDIEGNGSDELAFVTRQSNSGYDGGNLVILDAATGSELRRRASAFDNGFSSGGPSLKAIDIDGDGISEIVGAKGSTVAVLNGLTLADRWRVSNLQELVHEIGLMRFNADAVDDIVLALSNRLVILNGANGSELFRSVSFNSASEIGLAIGNADSDPQLEVAFGVGANVYIIDPALGLVESFFTASAPPLGIRFESLGGQCHITLTLADRLDRRDCATGVSQSARSLGMTAVHVGFATDSSGDLVVSDGTRIHRVTGNTVMASSRVFGSSLGFGNLGELTTSGDNYVVYVGGDQSVHRITMPPETALFASGFENP
jgi:hypothetical protein